MQFRAGPSERLRQAEWAVCLGATLAAIGLHISYLIHAGGLWRDEAESFRIATAATAGEMWRLLVYESFPVLFHTLVRCWWAVGLAGSDFALRLLGFCFGLCVLAALWWSSRRLGYRAPFISLALLATNLTLVRSGDSLRAYGCGCAFVLLTFSAVWALAQAPTRGRFVLASLASILSVQSLYQNAVLLLALCAAGAAVCFRRRQLRTIPVLLGVGSLAALSLVPYLKPVIRSQEWWIVSKVELHASILWSPLSTALGGPSVWPKWVWIGTVVLAIGVAARSLRKAASPAECAAYGMRLFAVIACVAGIVGFGAFLWLARLPTQPWQYLPLMTFVAACLDATLVTWSDRYPIWRLVFFIVMAGAPLPNILKATCCRQTNVDLVAAQLSARATAGDLIVVYPWYCGVSFDRYYQGRAPWTTLPALADHRVHRYDLLKEKLSAAAPIDSVLDQVAKTLAAGQRLWIVGTLPVPASNEAAPPSLPPAPNSRWGWLDDPYNYVWGLQTTHFIRRHRGGSDGAASRSPSQHPVRTR